MTERAEMIEWGHEETGIHGGPFPNCSQSSRKWRRAGSIGDGGLRAQSINRLR